MIRENIEIQVFLDKGLPEDQLKEIQKKHFRQTIHLDQIGFSWFEVYI